MPDLPPAHSGFAFPGLENLHNDIYPAISVADTPSLKQPGKVVLITGANRGIGRSIALQYAHAGVATLVLVARSSEKLKEVEDEIAKIDSGVQVRTFAANVSSEKDITTIKRSVETDLGRLDILINNAGAASPWAPIPQTEPAGWWNDFETSVKGPYLFLHTFLPLLTATAKKNKEDGKLPKVDVINMSSIGAHVLMSGGSAYQTAKLALLRLTEFVDLEVGSEGVVAVGMHPGGVLTELGGSIEVIRPLLKDTPELAGGFCVWLTAQDRGWLGGRYVAATWDVEKLESMREAIVEGDKLRVRMVV
ncbi:putative oxidoreductase [Massarina eburnea CBS 473.64]|uniref:Putative oxidoreductase n=1 Tax=Massarina eburnea CBS 473.64 TaxID=1395130 RepID=A0A6A6SA86_9PLEO|nr:putative oxidoreductase [Massarina eburnea CBS 473.64]